MLKNEIKTGSKPGLSLFLFFRSFNDYISMPLIGQIYLPPLFSTGELTMTVEKLYGIDFARTRGVS